MFGKKVPSHPRDRLKRRRTKQKNDVNDVVLVNKVPSHSRDRLKGLQRKYGTSRL